MEETTKFLEGVVSKEEFRLKDYLDEIAAAPDDISRVFCCNSSRSLYCPECCQILIPREKWPQCCCQDPRLTLPFTMDIVLGWKERRTSSSGIHMMTVRNMLQVTAKSSTLSEEADGDSDWWRGIRLFDTNRGDHIPSYATEQSTTFVLFPQPGRSMPISRVAHKLKRLIVVDVKWTRAGIVQLSPQLSKLQTVHLEYPPKQSHFWRWHLKGEGMLSTVEAIYFAAVEIAVARGWSSTDRERMIHIMWLFALQRSAITRQQRSENSKIGAVPLPFSTEGKNKQRKARMRLKDKANDDDIHAEEAMTVAFSKVSLT